MITEHCGQTKDHEQHVWDPDPKDLTVDMVACPGGPDPDAPPGPQPVPRPLRILDPQTAWDLQYQYQVVGFTTTQAWELTLAAARGVAG